ncbi:MAG: holdfast anchor protein HfaD [Caulobacteraceae bacterium]|nr:holdfast anchor protein HfaD [Caulobacter sp.]
MIRTAGTRARRLWLCAAATSLLALPAAAQTGGVQAANVQSQFGDVIANQALHVEEASDGVAGEATAVGNQAAASGGGDLALTSTQRLGPVYVGANPVTTVDGSAGALATTTASAAGNAGAVSVDGGYVSGTTGQTVDPGAIVSANGFTHLGALSGTLAADAAAVGDTQSWQIADGTLSATSVQAQGGRVAADSGASSLGGLTDEASHTASAVSNQVSVEAEGSSIALTANQAMTGETTHAAVFGYALGADDGQAQAASTGNAVSVSGDDSADIYAAQDNRGAVEAQSDLKLNSWNTAASDAYGVGNSVLVSNAGPVSIGVDQFQGGPVSAAASFTGYGGGDASTTATATGNEVSVATAGGVGGFANQETRGAVSATATLSPGAADSASATVRATGNSAVFQVTGSSR